MSDIQRFQHRFHDGTVARTTLDLDELRSGLQKQPAVEWDFKKRKGKPRKKNIPIILEEYLVWMAAIHQIRCDILKTNILWVLPFPDEVHFIHHVPGGPFHREAHSYRVSEAMIKELKKLELPP